MRYDDCMVTITAHSGPINETRYGLLNEDKTAFHTCHVYSQFDFKRLVLRSYTLQLTMDDY